MKQTMSPGKKDFAKGILIIVLLAVPLVFTRFFLLLPGFFPIFVTAAYYVGVLLYSATTLTKMRVQREGAIKRGNEVVQTPGDQAT